MIGLSEQQIGTLAKLRANSPHRASTTSSTRCSSKGVIQVVGGLYPGAVKDMVNAQPDLHEIRKMVIDRAGKCFLNVKDAFRNLQRIVTYRDGVHRVSRLELRAFIVEQLSLTNAISDTLFDALVEPGEMYIPHPTIVDFFGARIPWPEHVIPEEKEPPVEVSGTLAVGNQMPVGDKVEDSFWKVREMVVRRIILRHKNVRQAFRALDDDEDELINREQIRVWFKQMSIPMEMADRMFDEIDIDHNGYIDWPEFRRFFGDACGTTGAPTGEDGDEDEEIGSSAAFQPLMPGVMAPGGARRMSLQPRKSNVSITGGLERRGSLLEPLHGAAKVAEQAAAV